MHSTASHTRIVMISHLNLMRADDRDDDDCGAQVTQPESPAIVHRLAAGSDLAAALQLSGYQRAERGNRMARGNK